ncbi:YtxH domain-containing protein [Flagellimonas sp. S174]|uniref:YtxH domain-containing protein n=1 Tax=Flagellimonas sp. S174 TaxID=3410790 RepID=UPI003BF557E6
MSNNTNTVLGVLAGTAVGAAIGILFAPDKGSVTRQKIADEANKTGELITDRATQVKDAVVNGAQTQKATLDAKVEDLVNDASYKAEDVITALETRLKTLKEKNKKLRSA